MNGLYAASHHHGFYFYGFRAEKVKVLFAA